MFSNPQLTTQTFPNIIIILTIFMNHALYYKQCTLKAIIREYAQEIPSHWPREINTANYAYCVMPPCVHYINMIYYYDKGRVIH